MENKKKLIYADDLDEKLRNVVRRNCSSGGSIAVSDGVCMALSLLREAVPVDAVEVVHGQWIEHPNVEIVDGKRISNYECSRCCCFYRTHENYCGHCGAKMDGGNEDG